MNPLMFFHAICYGAVFLGGAALFIAPFTARGRVAPHWTRVALWLSCPIAMAWSLLGFTLLFGSHILSEHASFAISHTKTLLGGMGIGILVLLFVSGEFIGTFSSSKPPTEPR